MTRIVTHAFSTATLLVSVGAVAINNQLKAKPQPGGHARYSVDNGEMMRQDMHVEVTGKPKLVLNHLPKCGGSYIQDILRSSVSSDVFKLEKELEFLDKDDAMNFNIGLVRNPFEYYVSDWAYMSQQAATIGPSGNWDHMCCEYKAFAPGTSGENAVGVVSPFGSAAEDRQRFKQFLKIVSSYELGLLSLRFWGSYVNAHTWDLRTRGLIKPATDERIVSHTSEINDELQHFERLKGLVKCWVRVEYLEADLRFCLALYESEHGSGAIDWVRFNQSTASISHNPSDHAPCSKLFHEDEELRNFVLHSDAHIFRFFGYDHTCEQ